MIGSTIYSNTWRGYTGIVTKGYVHRLVEYSNEYVDKHSNHINGLEDFWGYQKVTIASSSRRICLAI